MAAQVSIMLEGQAGLNWKRWKNILHTAEDSGYQCVFRSDHFGIGKDDDSLELWISLAYAASHTKRIEFGPLVTPVTFRHPSMNVRYASQIDDLSGGRLLFGVGAGWHKDEHVQWGIPFYDFPTRYKMFTEALEMYDLLLNNNKPVSYEGEHFSLKDAILLPRPERAGGPPILIGGNGPKRTLPLVAKHAKEWNAVFLDIETYMERTNILNGLLAEQGRKPEDVKRSLMTRVVYGKDEATLKANAEKQAVDLSELRAADRVVGTGQEIVDKIAAWHEAGVERFMLQWMDLDDTEGMAAMAQDVLPHIHT